MLKLYRAQDNGHTIRLEEGNGAAVTFVIYDNTAQIVSLFVPYDMRGQGVGQSLLIAASREALRRRAKTIDVFFSEEVPGMSAFLKKNGFLIEEQLSVVRMDAKSILESERVKKLRKMSFADAKFVTIRELSKIKRRRLLNRLSHHSLQVSKNNFSRLSQDLSGVVYDDDGKPAAHVICSERDDCLYIEFLCVHTGFDVRYAAAALKGMLDAYILLGGTERHSEICAYIVQKDMVMFINRIMKGKKVKICARTFHGCRELTDLARMDLEYETVDDLIDNSSDEWEREAGRIDYQNNINWKNAWYGQHK